MLWREDESSLRIAEVCRVTGLSSSVIYNHFGSREGPVHEAYISLYVQASAQMLEQMHADTDTLGKPVEFYDYLRGELVDRERADFWRGLRQMRLRVASAAVSRADLREDFATAQDHHLQGLSAYLADLQERGLVGTHLAPDQMARVFEAYVLAHAYNDIALRPADGATWVNTFWAVLNPQSPIGSKNR